MATHAIPRPQWTGFFDTFSRDHLGQTATLELIGQEIGDQVVADAQIFRGISADEKDGENRIAIMLGATIDQGTTHSVVAPAEVWLEEGDGDTNASLEIRAADGSVMLLTFGPPQLPTA